MLEWLASSKPDIVCLQELKTAQADFPIGPIQEVGYRAVWKGEKTWNGVAILAKDAEPVITRDALPGGPSDEQSRYIEAAVRGVLIGCLYAPNGNPQPGPKFTYKLAWLERLRKHASKLVRDDVPAVLAGDYNVAPTPQDICPSKSWAKDALVQPESRAAFRRIIDQGWTDAIRALHPNEPMYTFWHYLRHRWARDAGLRLDHLLVSPSISTKLVDAGVDRDVRGVDGASDHAPAWIELRGAR
jgi:exodeoxyribonuclease-3